MVSTLEETPLMTRNAAGWKTCAENPLKGKRPRKERSRLLSDRGLTDMNYNTNQEFFLNSTS
jgi:hypothetical protein